MASVSEEQKKVAGSQISVGTKPPLMEVVSWFLTNGDTQSTKSPLHRLGITEHDAASGNHRHRGVDSSPLFTSADVISGDLATPAGLQTAVRKIAQLMAQLGATNNTTN